MKFGSLAKDKITEFEGIVTGKASYITGCDQYLLSPKSVGSDYKSGQWIDEGRLVLIDEDVVKIDSVKAEKNGCDIPAPVK